MALSVFYFFPQPSRSFPSWRDTGDDSLRLTLALSHPQPSRVTAHSVPSDQFKKRTVLLIKLNPEVLDREKNLPAK